MAKSTSLMLPQNANNLSVTFAAADTTTPKTIFTAGSNDSNVKAIVVASDDSAAINLKLFVKRSSVNYLLGTVNIPINSGANGTVVGVDLLAAAGMAGLPIDAVGKRYIPLKTGDTLEAGCLATMTAAKTCYVSVFGEDY